MKKGFDANIDLTKFASSLVKNDYQFVARYYNINNQSKNLTLAEASILNHAGLDIVVIWENGFPTTPGYFSHDKGVHDGTSAYFYANNQIHQPALTPIYFAVDYDASKDEIAGPISEYFKGVMDGFNTISNNNPSYIIGVYGSGLVCSTLLQNNLVGFTWLAQSMGWRGSRTFKDFNFKQGPEIIECVDLGGVNGDGNISPNDNEGSFKVETNEFFIPLKALTSKRNFKGNQKR